MTWKYTFIPQRKIHHSSANQEKGNILKCTFTPRIIEKDKAKMTQKVYHSFAPKTEIHEY